MRRITINDVIYLWRVAHQLGGDQRREVFTAYEKTNKRAPLRVIFTQNEFHGREYIERSGIVMRYQADANPINLNLPGVVRKLIERALEEGWHPETATAPFIIEDGFSFIDNLL